MPSNKLFGLLAVFLFSLTIPSIARAQTPMGEVMCACPGKSKPLGEAPNCEVACSGKPYSPRSGNAAAEQRAREGAANDAAAKEKEDREAAEAEERRQAEERQRQQDAANQKAFEDARDEAARTLKGSTGTTIRSNSPDGTGLRGSGSDGTSGNELRGSRSDSGLRTGNPSAPLRDFSGPHAAWKELFCAASILGPAIKKLGVDPKEPNPDYAAFKVLASEATNALNGEVKGVPCAKAPEPPTFFSNYSDPAKLAADGIRLVDKVVDLATKLEKARDQKTEAQAEMNKPAPLAPPAVPGESVIAKQRAIIRMREEEAKRIARAQRDFNTGVTTENEAKAKLGKIADAVKKAEENPEDLSVLLQEEAPAPPNTPVKPKPTIRRPGKP